jgi:hypothetical protein
MANRISKLRRTAVVSTVLITLSGCTLAELTSINRSFDIEKNTSKLIDVKQRTVLVSNHRGSTKPIVCAEPSPDALTILSASLSGQVQLRSGDSGSLAAALAEAGGSIGLRTQSIQLLRDGFYRLCESYLSGAIDREEYDLLQRRYQANMIALLAIEQLTGAVRAPTVVLASKSIADAGTNLAGLIQAKDQTQVALDQAKDKQKKLEAEIAALKPPGDQAKIDELNKRKADVEKDISRHEKTLSDLNEAISRASSAVATAETSSEFETLTGTSSKFDAETAKVVAEAVVQIAQTVIAGDYTQQVCFSYLRHLQESGASKPFALDPAFGVVDPRTIQPHRVIGDLADICANLLVGRGIEQVNAAKAAEATRAETAKKLVELLDRESRAGRLKLDAATLEIVARLLGAGGTGKSDTPPITYAVPGSPQSEASGL